MGGALDYFYLIIDEQKSQLLSPLQKDNTLIQGLQTGAIF